MNFRFQDSVCAGVEGHKVGGLCLLRAIATLQTLQVKKNREFLLYSHEFTMKL